MKLGVNLPPQGAKVFVGLSGGVDSAVAAALLKEAGMRVTGVFIKGWYPPGMPCTWREDRRDAMRVAAYLRIPFLTLDASQKYKEDVIDYLLREYKAGRTPNPDIMCNREVKFGAFHAFAKEQGADAIATGHYARAERAPDSPVRLSRGIDPAKDQSYFLWAVPQTALTDAYFPLGSMHKEEVRKLADRYGLPNAHKRDSQGICFLGNVSVEEFLAQEFGTQSGSAIDTEGKRIGTHAGVLLSTLGQRVQLADAPAGPWYVIAKDIAANALTVSKEKRAGQRTSFRLESTNWLSQPAAGKSYAAQYRYHGPLVPGTLDESLSLFKPTQAVTEPIAQGQSLVMYDGEECIGGGIIG